MGGGDKGWATKKKELFFKLEKKWTTNLEVGLSGRTTKLTFAASLILWARNRRASAPTLPPHTEQIVFNPLFSSRCRPDSEGRAPYRLGTQDQRDLRVAGPPTGVVADPRFTHGAASTRNIPRTQR